MADLIPVNPVAVSQEMELTGTRIIEGANCVCGNDIRPGDLVAANFDRKHVHSGGGLYLVTDGRGWYGCRRMMRVPDGVAIDQDSHGDWVTLPSLDGCALRVIGVVESVYKHMRYQ